MSRSADVLVLGSGIAGLTFALKVAEHASVLLLTKKERADSNTNYARGGIAAVVGEDDDLALHVRDTLVAGAGLCHRRAVEALVREGPARVQELVAWGTAFHREGGRLSLGREGGHSRRRIVHAGDRTGRAIERALLDAVEAEPRIEVLEDHLALDLVVESTPAGRRRCAGVVALDHRVGRIVEARAATTLLATGGCGQVYVHTTNPSIATGDGVAMAHRAGATIGNMEFVQFHPTALHPTEDPAFLVSEALRGEGAVLRRRDGEAFMDHYHPLGSLAPRDVVARAVDRELRRSGDSHVVLDVSAVGEEEMRRRFPGAVEGCLARGVDLFSTGIPVVPAAHYACGGVVTDHEGRTSLDGLLAAGEAACTGVHGANRLASNSLLEAVVYAHRAARRVARDPRPQGRDAGPWGPGRAPVPGTAAEGRTPAGPGPDGVEARRRALRTAMWERVGIVRSDALLAEAEDEAAAAAADEDRRWTCADPGALTPEAAELRNLSRTALLVARCARRRLESRGLHHNVDHPWRDNERGLRDTLLEGP